MSSRAYRLEPVDENLPAALERGQAGPFIALMGLTVDTWPKVDGWDVVDSKSRHIRPRLFGLNARDPRRDKRRDQRVVSMRQRRWA